MADSKNDITPVWIRTDEGEVVQMPKWLVPSAPCRDGSRVVTYASKEAALVVNRNG